MAYDNQPQDRTAYTRPAAPPRPADGGSGGLWMLVGGMAVAVLGILWYLGVFSSGPAPATVTGPSVVIEAPAAQPAAPALPAVPATPDTAIAPSAPDTAAPAEAQPADPAPAAPAAPAVPAPGN
ncbi:MAG TPA: hypothetical protein PKC84_17435 [Paracoccaceae bacterium]|nr:hypothetical protein [Paracoccaceae bacterium]